MKDDGDLTLIVGGAAFSGWTSVQVVRGIEVCPNSYSVSLTELAPDTAMAVVAKPGDSCQVKLGDDIVLTGYVDRYSPEFDAKQHTIQLVGRGKCQDFVDCAAEWPTGQIVGASVLDIAKKLAQPYGIKVKALCDTGANIPQLNLNLGETAYETLERIARFVGVLLYEDVDGTLLINQAGNGAMSSGIVQGENLMHVRATWSMDERFSTYNAYLQSMDVLKDTGTGGNLLATATDAGVPRHRQRDIITESGGGGMDVAIKRAKWDAARRAGRGYQIEATIDSWRDGSGTLWTPNYKIPIDIPGIKHPTTDWVIGQVQYLRDEEGTRASLLIMPKAAFIPEPVLLLPYFADIPAKQ